MRYISQQNNKLEIEAFYEEIAVMEQSIGIINGTFKVENFIEKIGTKQKEIEKVRLYLRDIVDQNQEYHELCMNDWQNPKIHELKTNIQLEAQSLPWIVNSINLALIMAPEDEFGTLTGYDRNFAIKVLKTLKSINE